MKPFITPEVTAVGKMYFPYQYEGVEREALSRELKGQRLVAYVLPDGHTLQAAWGISFVFDSGLVLEFSSACTQAIGWQEVGSLNIRLMQGSMDSTAVGGMGKNEVVVPTVELLYAEKLLYEDEDVVVECGLLLHGRTDQNVVISAGISPGSVSVHAPFSVGQLYEPQFPLSGCLRQEL
jgi:hypothetical protein